MNNPRTKDVLFDFENISIMFQYLYMNVDHKITFNNGITDLQLHMNDDLDILCKNLSFPDIPESNYSSEMNPNNCFIIIDLLKEMPAEEYPKRFSNRWEEIKSITRVNLSLNRK